MKGLDCDPSFPKPNRNTPGVGVSGEPGTVCLSMEDVHHRALGGRRYMANNLKRISPGDPTGDIEPQSHAQAYRTLDKEPTAKPIDGHIMITIDANKGYHRQYIPPRLEPAWKVMSVYVPRWGQLAHYLLFDSQENRGTKVQSLISRAG